MEGLLVNPCVRRCLTRSWLPLGRKRLALHCVRGSGVYVYVGCFVTAVTFSAVKKEKKIPTPNMLTIFATPSSQLYVAKPILC